MRCIDADALQKEYMHEHAGKRLMLIDVAPTIEPERKKGKWINIREGNRADCDQCGQSGRAWMNFCFLCGAKMEGQDERDI